MQARKHRQVLQGDGAEGAAFKHQLPQCAAQWQRCFQQSVEWRERRRFVRGCFFGCNLQCIQLSKAAIDAQGAWLGRCRLALPAGLSGRAACRARQRKEGKLLKAEFSQLQLERVVWVTGEQGPWWCTRAGPPAQDLQACNRAHAGTHLQAAVHVGARGVVGLQRCKSGGGWQLGRLVGRPIQVPLVHAQVAQLLQLSEAPEAGQLSRTEVLRAG